MRKKACELKPGDLFLNSKNNGLVISVERTGNTVWYHVLTHGRISHCDRNASMTFFVNVYELCYIKASELCPREIVL